MLKRAGLIGVGSLFVLGLSGCPMTDDYFIDVGPAHDMPGGGSVGNAGAGGAGPSSRGGSGPSGANAGGASGAPGPAGGTPNPGGSAGAGSGPPGTCSPETERCNGHDDNCNDVVDEQVCNSRQNGTTGCAGFVIPSRPDHGYMLCSTTPKTYAEAQRACEQQSMRLAWLETKPENDEVATKVNALTTDEVTFGATDAAEEGAWVWDGVDGAQFWQGNESGKAVAGGFVAWAPGTPNDDNGGEDCAVINPASHLWGDRSCTVQYAYLCEEPD